MKTNTKMDISYEIKDKMHKEACLRLKLLNVDKESYYEFSANNRLTMEESCYNLYHKKGRVNKEVLECIEEIQNAHNILIYYVVKKEYCDGMGMEFYPEYNFFYVDTNIEKYKDIREEIKNNKNVPVYKKEEISDVGFDSFKYEVNVKATI